jgi:hypothetical protein
LEKQARGYWRFSCPMLLATRRTGHVADLLARFALASDKAVPAGWAPRALVQCRVAYAEIWDILHGIYESQIRFIVLIYHPPPSLSFIPLHFWFSIVPQVSFPSPCEIPDTLTSSLLPCMLATPPLYRSIPRMSSHLTISLFYFKKLL